MTSPRDPLRSQVVVVTGASSGIGRAVALKLAKDGFDIVVHAGSNRAAAEQVVDEIAALGQKAIAMVCDFAESAGFESFVQACWDWQGEVTSWCNIAGVDVLTGDAAEWSFETKLDAVLQIDVVATLLLSRSVGKKMMGAFSRDQKVRSIINLGWDQAAQGMGGDSGEMFATSKGAIMAMSKSLAQTMGPAVRVNCIAPGWIQTKWGQQASETWQRQAAADALCNRWGQPEDVAAMASFLVSPDAEFINGQIMNVNGGFRYTR
ncbi:MAG: SDR family oxidoreductase [Planctomycetaceae bacterium]|nr:SDR family oxidoreductase [Planctomycetaceae bacterium]